MKKILRRSILALGASGMMLLAQSSPAQYPPTTQGAAATDSEMTAKVRQGLMQDTTVGTASQHIRVNTRNGVVTLRGKVETQDEKDAALAKAKQIAGDANVKDEITVSKD